MKQELTPFTDYLIKRKETKGYLFVPYLALGDPDWQSSEEIVDLLILSGADTIELGLPFSDPSADGPVLQRAFRRSLSHPFSLEHVFQFLEKISRKHPDFKFSVMAYANLFHAGGFDEMLKRLYALNVGGVIVPDVPLEEAPAPAPNRPDWIQFITPTTRPERLKAIVSVARGFIYLVSLKGTTGQSGFTLEPLRKTIQTIRKQTRVPVLAGFGIRNAAHAREAATVADGFIIGSRIHEIIEENLSNHSVMKQKLIEELKGISP